MSLFFSSKSSASTASAAVPTVPVKAEDSKFELATVSSPLAGAMSLGSFLSTSAKKKVHKRKGTERGFSVNGPIPQMTITEMGSANRVYKHITSYTVSAWLTASNAGAAFANHGIIASNDITNFSSWSTVFDQYRIRRVQAWILPRTSQQATSAVTANQGQLVSVIDYDDSANLSSFNAGMQYANALLGPGQQGHYRDFEPHIAVAVYSGAFTSFANMDASTWIDCASTGVNFFGLKAGVTLTDASYVYDLDLRLHVEFRNSR